jgi:hypothetical protein
MKLFEPAFPTSTSLFVPLKIELVAKVGSYLK